MMSEHVYDDFRQDSVVLPRFRGFVPSKADAISGSRFTALTLDMPADERDELIYNEIISGNVPDGMRCPVYITDSLADAEGRLHEVTLCLLPDVLAVG